MAADDQIVLQFGWYRHPFGTAAYTLDRQMVFDGRKNPAYEEVNIGITGKLYAEDATQMQIRWAELDAAYRQTNADFLILLNNGVTVYSILSGSTLGGIRVSRRPSRPTTVNAEHYKYLSFSIELQATLPAAATSSAGSLLSFRETLQFSGGGPRTRMIESLFGIPIKQQVRNNTIYRAVQSGQAVALFGLPQIPPPIWPNDWTGDLSGSRTGPEEFWGGIGRGRSVSWSYTFESAFPYTGLPNEWGTAI